MLQQLALHARREAGINLPFSATTPYQNTIPSRQQPPFPGSQEMERRIKSLVRWNALAMVVRANKMQEGIGGHISTFASAATLYEVAFNHFFRAQTESGDRDIVYRWPGFSGIVKVLRDISMPNLTKAIVLEGCGHWTQQERSNEVNELLIEFLAGLP